MCTRVVEHVEATPPSFSYSLGVGGGERGRWGGEGEKGGGGGIGNIDACNGCMCVS